jgi:hypothetical protein
VRAVVELLPFLVVAVVVVIGGLQLLSSSDLYGQIGRGGLSLDEGAQTPPASTAERDDEIRQMLAARNARRERQGAPALDVESELQRLTGANHVTTRGGDPALAREVRELVIARNARRARRGQPPLDVDAEVRRQLEEL